MPAKGTVHFRRSLSLVKQLQTKNGFTFIEIMVTLIILSVGIVGVYQALFKSLDLMSRLNSRLYANILLDDQIATVERRLRAYKTLPTEMPAMQEVSVGVKTINYEPQLRISEVDQYTDVFRIDLIYAWTDNKRQVQMERSAYVSDFLLDDTIQ